MTFDDLIKTFKVQPDLNREFWTSENKLNPTIRKALLRIAKEFYDGVELENKPKIKDIVFTGSLANYNYSDYSDIDLHLLFDFGKDKELLSQFFLLAKSKWNDKHDITIKGYDVEVYAEDEKSPHVSTGLYSVMKDKWIKEPKQETPVFDELDVKTKVNYFVGMVKQLFQQYQEGKLEGLDTKIEKLRDKLSKFRQGGLQLGGEFSTENIAFKLLRRAGYMDKLAKLQDAVVDKQLSVAEMK
jgi:predicted nucleotidyltransferase